MEPKMRAADERPASVRMWLVTCIFFILIASGVTLLILSMVLHTSGSNVLYPVIGMILVAIPWVFWFATCFYRFMKGRLLPRNGQQQPTAPLANSGGAPSKEASNSNDVSGDERPLA